MTAYSIACLRRQLKTGVEGLTGGKGGGARQVDEDAPAQLQPLFFRLPNA